MRSHAELGNEVHITEAGIIQMSSQRGWRLAIAGLGHRGHFFRERWRLLNPGRIVTLADDEPDNLRSFSESGLAIRSLSELTARPGDCNAVLVTVPLSQRGTLVADLLLAGLSVLVEPPLALTLIEAQRLLSLAKTHHAALRTVGLRRTEQDFLAAVSAKETGRLGLISSLRWYAAEYAVWAGDTARDYRRGETLTVAGPPIFDQLAGLLTSVPKTVWGRSFPAEDGFAVDIEFTDGSHSHIELRRTARAALHTGWIIEGDAGTYHHRRLITTTADGELVDETMPIANPATDPLQELEAMPTLVPMFEAEQERCLVTAGLLEAVQRSIAIRAPVDWASL